MNEGKASFVYFSEFWVVRDRVRDMILYRKQNNLETWTFSKKMTIDW